MLRRPGMGGSARMGGSSRMGGGSSRGSGGKLQARRRHSGSSVASHKSYRSDRSTSSLRSSTRTTCISVENRMYRVEEGVEMFHMYLSQAPSICLPASFRWAIALETRACLECPGCAKLNEGDHCEKTKHHAAHPLLKTVQHSDSPDLPYCVTDRASWEKVRNLVHFTINHQARANADWYSATIKSLGHTSLIPKKQFPEGSPQRAVLMATLFSEILATTLLSHAIHTTFIALGKDVPPLPDFQEEWDRWLPPTYQDVITQGIIKNNKGIRWPTTTLGSPVGKSSHKSNANSHVPIITHKDIDVTSPAWDNFYSPSVRDYLMANMIPMHPLSVLSLAPATMALCGTIMGSKLSIPETMLPWKKLDRSLYCIDGGFTRADFEICQIAVAECYQTVF